MTDSTPQYPTGADRREFRRSMHFANRLAAAAYGCATNYRWLTANRYSAITMLDFDVICGALPTVAAQKALLELKDQSHQSGEAAPDEGEVLFDNLIGPSTFRFHLHNLTDFTLPHGSAAELLSWKARLSGHLSKRSREFMKRLDTASSAADPAITIMHSSGGKSTVTEVLRAEIKSFEDQYNELSLLDQLIDRATPIEDLTRRSSPEPRSGDAFRMVLNHLQVLRPYSSINNLNDAINVSLLVRLFNMPAAQQNERHIPILISGTRPLAEFSYPPQWFYFPYNQKNPPDFIKDRLYLVVTQSLLAFYENRYRSVVDSASFLHEQLTELAEGYRVLIEAIDNRRRDIVPYQWELMQHKQQMFQDEWAPIFEVAVNSAQLDRTFYSNLLLTPDIVQDFERGGADEMRQGITRFIDQLQQYRHPIFDQWQLADVAQVPSVTEAVQQKESVEMLFDLSVVDNDGTLLSELNKGKQITQEDTVDRAHRERDLRYVLHLKSDPIGAVLAIDSWDDDPRIRSQRVGVVWRHKLNAVSIWEQGVRLLRACLRSEHSASLSCSYRLFMRSMMVGDQTTLAAAPNVMSGKPERSSAVQYFEVKVGQFTFFADVKPLDDVEMQAGLVMSRKLWDSSLYPVLAQTLAEASTVSLNAAYYSTILRFMADKVGL